MTQPTEESIRAACEEAGVLYARFPYFACTDPAKMAIEALARRIEAEREAVVMAYKIIDPSGDYWFTSEPENPDMYECELAQIPLYAHQPKGPTT